MEDLKKQMKTGTTTVGLVCKDGIVLAADMRATAGSLIVGKKTDKISQISDDMAVTMAGTVSDAQLLIKLIRAELKLREIRTGRKQMVKEAANLLGGLVYANIRRMSMIPGISHFLLGGKDEKGYYVYDIFPDGSVTLMDDYVSSGSGSEMAYGVLETSYKKDLTTEQGTSLVIKCINAALQRDVNTGEGINVVTITEKGVRKVISKQIDARISE
jgi:proteasome beta subunit